ncbi:MAG: OmpA family protein [Acetobacteraceae bacterium]|nr:OmpA family protein [Acetobacteraceae bacterium]
MRLRSALLAATVLAAPVAVQAQPISGLYVGAGAGVNFKQDQNFTGLNANVGPLAPFTSNGNSLKLTYDTGWVGVASVGYGLGNGLRLEVEGNYRDNNVRTLHGTPFPTAAGGDTQTYGAMVNVLYDVDVASYTGVDWVMPYVGVGAGYAWTKLHAVKASGTTVPFFGRSDDTDGNFAYQAIVGAAIPIDAMPGLAFTAEYRFFGVIGDTSYKGAVDTGATAATFTRTFGSAKLGDQYNHSILAGVRYAFNAAPPPPPPAPIVAPAPAAARSYLVFFDWDRADLSDRARQIIAEAARNSTSVQYTRIEVNGYTDTSGSAEYNQRLSVRRAQNVAAELVKDGVPRQAIAIQGFGETHLLVPTGPNVREPQNRRVEIILH